MKPEASLSEVKKSALKAEISAAKKSGAAWAEMFINKYRENPAGYVLEGWVEDAENLFKGNTDERIAFYDTLQKAPLHEGNDQGLVRNGFDVVTRSEVEHQCIMAMAAFEQLETIFNAIKRIAGEKETEIASLAEMGRLIAADIDNELDCLRECAEKAGTLGELVEAARNHAG